MELRIPIAWSASSASRLRSQLLRHRAEAPGTQKMVSLIYAGLAQQPRQHRYFPLEQMDSGLTLGISRNLWMRLMRRMGFRMSYLN